MVGITGNEKVDLYNKNYLFKMLVNGLFLVFIFNFGLKNLIMTKVGLVLYILVILVAHYISMLVSRDNIEVGQGLDYLVYKRNMYHVNTLISDEVKGKLKDKRVRYRELSELLFMSIGMFGYLGINVLMGSIEKDVEFIKVLVIVGMAVSIIGFIITHYLLLTTYMLNVDIPTYTLVLDEDGNLEEPKMQEGYDDSFIEWLLQNRIVQKLKTDKYKDKEYKVLYNNILDKQDKGHFYLTKESVINLFNEDVVKALNGEDMVTVDIVGQVKENYKEEHVNKVLERLNIDVNELEEGNKGEIEEYHLEDLYSKYKEEENEGK